MNAPMTSEQIRALSVEERLRLIEDVWASLADDPESVPVPDWHLEILAERLAEDDADHGAGEDWEIVRRRIERGA